MNRFPNPLEVSRRLFDASSLLATGVKEYDTAPRSCIVYLFTRPLKEKPAETRIAFQHWAIVVVFEDDSWRTAEGSEDDDCKLRAYYTKQSPKENGSYYKLGEIESLSPSQLWNYVVKVTINDLPYHLTLNNCQKWAKELANKLGSHIQQSIDNFKSISESNPHLASLVKTGIGSYKSSKNVGSSRSPSTESGNPSSYSSKNSSRHY